LATGVKIAEAPQPQILSALIRANLVASEVLVDRTVRLHSIVRRNTSYVVSSPAASYFVKYPKSLDRADTIANELIVYALLARKLGRRVHAFVPRSYPIASDAPLLVVELCRGFADMRRYRQRSGMHQATLRHLALFLSLCHSVTTGSPGAGKPLRMRRPFALTLYAPSVSVLRMANRAQVTLLRTIQGRTPLCDLLQAVDRDWQSTALMHGDLRFENVLVAIDGRREIRVVDWEFAGCGDPWWDVGSVFAEHLDWCLRLKSNDLGASPTLAMLEAPLRAMRPALRSFWDAYAVARSSRASVKHERMQRAFRYAAIRLIQREFESTRVETPPEVLAAPRLRLAWNILRSPASAALRVLGRA
jgi:aminoglycoside phosphotransferase (APT) family kinase protein